MFQDQEGDESEASHISKYQLEKQKRSPVRNAKVGRKDRLASRQSDALNRITATSNTSKRQRDRDRKKNQSACRRGVSIKHQLLERPIVERKVNSKNTRSKQLRSSSVTDFDLTEKISIQSRKLQKHREVAKRKSIEDDSDDAKSRVLKSDPEVTNEKEDTQIRTKDSNTKKTRRSWTTDEDEALRLSIKNIKGDWATIAKEIPNRTGQQCCQRWHESLKFSVGRLKSQWSPEEDSIIIRLQRENGNKWAAIARELKCRTATEVRNRFTRNLQGTKRNQSKEATLQLTKYQLEKQKRLPVRNADDLHSNSTKKRQKIGGVAATTILSTQSNMDYTLQMHRKKAVEHKSDKVESLSAKYMENESLKEQFPKKNEKNLVIDELAERLNGRKYVIVALINRLKEQLSKKNEEKSLIAALKKEMEELLAKNNGKDLVIKAQNKEIEKLKLAKKNEKDLVIDELIDRLKEQLSRKNDRESVIVALINRLKQQLPKKNREESEITALKRETKELWAKNNGQFLVVVSQNKEIDRLKEQLAKKNENDLVINERNMEIKKRNSIIDTQNMEIERLKQQLSENKEKDSIIDAQQKEIENLQQQILKNKEKDSIIAAQNIEIERLKQQLSMNKQVQEMQASLKDLQEDLQCPICFNPMKDPCIVPECCHRFCYACIEDAIAKCGKECPICRARITSKRDLRRDELFGKIAEVVCCQKDEEDIEKN